MRTSVRAGYQDVVEVDEDVGKTTKNPVHESLKTLGGIFQSKRHRQELEQAKRCHYGRFTNVFRSHRNLVVSFH